MNLNASPSFKYARPFAAAPYLEVVDHDGIEPLDDQIGAFPKLDMPATAEAALFGGDHGDLFALLDGAAITGLEERIEAEGLDHRCLFSGAAEEEYHAAAPRLVRLTRGSTLLRSMFTKAGRPWDLWQTKAGVFLRSQASIDQLRAHLRHFTRVQDSDEKWFFFRFCDAEAMYHYLSMDPPLLDNMARFFEARHEHKVTWILPVGSRLRVLTNRYRHQPRSGVMRLSAEEFDALRQGKWWSFLERVDEAIRTESPALSHKPEHISALGLEGFQKGFRIEKALYLYIHASLLCHNKGRDPRQLLSSLQDDGRSMSQLDLAEQFYRNSV